MFCLYFSLSSSFLFLALYKKNKCLSSIQKENSRLHSENFLSQLQQILEKSNCSLQDLNEIYFTSNPSGQTGLRVTLSFLATLQILNLKIKLFYIDTLLLQAGNDNCVSLLTIDSRGSKYYGEVYQEKECLLKTQIILKENLAKLTEKFPNFLIRKDFGGIDFLANFQKLKNNFVLLEKIEEIDC